MALRLIKTRDDEPSSNGAVPVNTPLDFDLVDVNSVSSFSITQDQLGGSFNFSTIGVNPLIEGTFGSIFKNYYGVVERAGVNISTSGIDTVYEGRVSGIAYKNYDNLSFSSSTPFVRPDGSLVAQPFLPTFDNHYRLIDLRASSVIQILADRAGYRIASLNLPIDYLVWRYEVIGGATLEAIEEVAKAGGANAILRTDGIHVIPYGSYVQEFIFDFEDLMESINPRVERTEFTQVVVSPSSDVTPWNSTYEGTPEQLATIEFKAGISEASDSSFGSMERSTDWFYPKNGQNNNWIRYTGSSRNFKASMFQAFGQSHLWAVEQHTSQRVNFNSFDTFYVGASPRLYDQVTITPTNPEQVDVDVLFTWGTAAKKFESQGDIHDELIVVPYEQTEFNSTFGVDASDLFNTRLLGYGKGSIPSSVGSWQIGYKDLLPDSFYTCRVFSNPECTQEGFAKDGSFYIGLMPHNNRIYTTLLTQSQPVADTSGDDSEILLDNKFTVDVRKGRSTGEFPSTQVQNQAEPLIDEDGVSLRQADNIVQVRYARGVLTDAMKSERRKALKSLQKVLAGRHNGIKLLGNVDRKFETRSSSIEELTTEEEYLRVATGPLPTDRDFVNFNFSCVVLYENDFGIPLTEVSTDISAVTSVSRYSGTPSQASIEPLEGKWTLYKLPRVTYTPTIVNKVGQASGVAYYPPEQIPTGNSKTVSSSLITDHTTPSSHAMRLAGLLATYLSTPFYSFSGSVVYQGKIPQVGDLIRIRNVPVFGEVASVVTSGGISGSAGDGVTVNFTCGRFQTI